MAEITFRRAASKATWRTLCLANLIATFYLWRVATTDIRHAKMDPLDGVIGWTLLAIWGMAEITAMGYVVIIREWRHGR